MLLKGNPTCAISCEIQEHFLAHLPLGSRAGYCTMSDDESEMPAVRCPFTSEFEAVGLASPATLSLPKRPVLGSTK